jgi:prophage regulatory protein
MTAPPLALASHQLLRLPTVIALTGLSRSTIYRLMSENAFPKGLKPTARTIAWRSADITDWIESRDIRE